MSRIAIIPTVAAAPKTSTNGNGNGHGEPATPSTSRKVTFTKAKETQNTVVFKEDKVAGQPPIIGTLYIQQWVAGEAQHVTLTVELA